MFESLSDKLEAIRKNNPNEWVESKLEHKAIIFDDTEYSIQHNSYLDINIIMKPVKDGEHYKYEFVDYIHGDLGRLSDVDIWYYINKYESNRSK